MADSRLLLARRERPRGRRAAKKRDELAPCSIELASDLPTSEG
jgi:hypothetical protein